MPLFIPVKIVYRYAPRYPCAVLEIKRCKRTLNEILSIEEGDFAIEDTVAVIRTQSGKRPVSMLRKWPVRRGRPYKEKLSPTAPMITGQGRNRAYRRYRTRPVARTEQFYYACPFVEFRKTA